MTIYLHLASFCEAKNFLKKLEKMCIEQIIEFELRGLEPPGRTCNPKTGYFCEKT